MAPAGTFTVIFVGVSLVMSVAASPLKDTSVATARLVPVMVTIVPGGPDDGVNPVIVGGPDDLANLVVLIALPKEVVTPMSPVVAPGAPSP